MVINTETQNWLHLENTAELKREEGFPAIVPLECESCTLTPTQYMAAPAPLHGIAYP